MEQIKIGDEIGVVGTVIAVTDSGNPIIKLKSGIKTLVKYSDVKTHTPKIEKPKKDMRKGN